MTYAVIALDLESRDVDLRRLMAGTARKFKPHVTILPRFELRAEHEGDAFARYVEAIVDGLAARSFVLVGPRWAEADLA